ncbi:MAG: hypothetical protein KBF27_11290, partial [Cypionkella sp.]|nr:hypothetical protein [Cypionkella sp.]
MPILGRLYRFQWAQEPDPFCAKRGIKTGAASQADVFRFGRCCAGFERACTITVELQRSAVGVIAERFTRADQSGALGKPGVA